MSEENNNSSPAPGESDAPSGKSVAGGGTAEGSTAANLINILKTNKKAQYAVIGAVILVILASFMGGGGGEIAQITPAVLNVGQQVTLDNPNGGKSHLTAVPGLFSAESPEDDEQTVCTVPAGTKGTVVEENVVGMLHFIKVEITDGECKGKTGWTSKVNVKAG